MKNINTSSGYSIIMALLIIWFLLVLSIGIFNLVLNEMKDNRAMWDYIKVYAWAESAQELALLKIKKEWYGYYESIDRNNERSIVLAEDPINRSALKAAKDVVISYDIWSKTNSYTWSIGSIWYNIIPLFYKDDVWDNKIVSMDLTIISWDVAWNIIGKTKWISWTWAIIWNVTTWHMKTLNVVDPSDRYFELDSTKRINDFLDDLDSVSNYLVLFNIWTSRLSYKLKANNSWEFFTKPETTIISSAEVWNYRQNLSTELKNTDFLDMLKYSIYSN